MKILPLTLLCLLAGAALAPAKEITSNGLGGGRWSDASTWRGGAMPGPEDEAVIAARDTVLFDRNDVDAPSCKQLILDPASNFAFQSGLGKRTLSVNGPIELYGSLKMHAAAASDDMEIRLASTVDTERSIKLTKGGSLLVLGRSDLPEGKYNAAIVVSAPPVGKVLPTGTLTAGPKTGIDLQNARIENLAVGATSIDNTGAKPNERVNFSGNLFAKFSVLTIYGCDTPGVVKNIVDSQGVGMVRPHAIAVAVSPLAEVRGNRVLGIHAIGIGIDSSEGSASDNYVEGCPQGIVWHTGPCMLKHNTISKCTTGLSLRTVTGSAEDTTIDACDLPILTASAKVQITSAVITNAPKPILMETTTSSIGLLNCHITPEQIKSVRAVALPRALAASDPAVETMEFLVVGLKGTVPPRALVALHTLNPATPLAPGASDLNIRNSPAPVRGAGTTPLPPSLTPLIVKSWWMDEECKVVAAPEYTLDVLEPSAEAGVKPRVLKSIKVKPDDTWFRADPNDTKPTLEVTLP